MAMSCLGRDLGAIFNSSDFGEDDGSVTWRGAPLVGFIFDDEDIQQELGEGVAEIVHQAVLTGPSAQVIGIRDLDPVVINGAQFRVKNWMDDGTGVIEIYLEALS